MEFIIIGIVCLIGSVGGIETGGTWFTFGLTVILGILSIIKGIRKISS